MITQSLGSDNSWNISFTVHSNNADKALYIINKLRKELGAVRIDCLKDVAKVSIIGSGIMENPKIPAQMFTALTEANVNIRMISTSELKLSVVVDADEGHRALVAVHGAFFGE